ncbi:hypothetical protein [Colwellia sp. C1TZA3]|uniref:DUF3024 domain-containing protein n=1 Tax=Colwellia sp. C1TZA3 TaxID=2508879 RepID=UPI0011B9E18C|nr:hypothetical protein [Colwellia sp. C1TZA3]TWX63226.1 hypothetical protein ESZ39_17165 [Colwellia sp. C1TZA3]
MKITNVVKDSVNQEASDLINNTLKPRYIKHEIENNFSNQLFDISLKWRGSSLYFLAKYNCVAENAISPTFESKFARLVFVGDNRFNLSYMRHTDKWFELHSGLSSKECFKAIEAQPYFVV